MPPKSKTTATPRCSSCNHSIKTSFNANLHPLLKVLICRKCYFLYGTGDFSEFENGIDENGDDNYCRLCVDGGELYFCSNSKDSYSCHYAFCRECIAKLHPQDPLINEEPNAGDKWKCLVCEESKTAEARREAQETLRRLNIEDLERNAVLEEANANGTKKPPPQSSPQHKIASPRSGPSIDLTSHIIKEKPRVEAESKSTKAANPPPASEKPESLKTSDSESKKTENSKQAASASIPTKAKPDKMSDKPLPTTEKVKVAKAEVAQQREPEAVSMPPLEKPKPPKTSLRTLGPRSSLSSAMHPSTASNRDEETRASSTSQKPAKAPSDIRQPLKQNQLIRSEPAASKKLKLSRQTVASCILLSEPELKNRLREYEILKENHIKRLSQHFDSIIKHFHDPELNSPAGDELMRSHIDSLRRSVHDINNMFADLESLWGQRNKKV